MGPEQSGIPDSVQSDGTQETVFDYYIPSSEISPGMTSPDGQESEQRGHCSINPNTSSDSSSVDPNLYLKATNEKTELNENRMSYDMAPGPSDSIPGQHGVNLTEQMHLDETYGETRVSFQSDYTQVPVNDFTRFNQNYCTFQY